VRRTAESLRGATDPGGLIIRRGRQWPRRRPVRAETVDKCSTRDKEKSAMNGRSIKLFMTGALMLSTPLSIRPQSATTSVSPQQQQESAYVCPMHPEVKSKDAGTCPKCGMTLKQMSGSQASAAQTRYGAGHIFV